MKKKKNKQARKVCIAAYLVSDSYCVLQVGRFCISYAAQDRWSERVEYNFYSWFAFWLLPDLSRIEQKVIEVTTHGAGGGGGGR